MGTQGRGVWRSQYAVSLLINNRPLALGIAAPEHEHHCLGLPVNQLYGAVRKLLPALALVSSERLAYLGGFGLASILAMSGFAWLLAMIVGRLPQSRERVRRGALIGASTLAVVVGLVWLALASRSQKLQGSFRKPVTV